MQVKFSQNAKDQLMEIKAFIAMDNPQIAAKHIQKVLQRIKNFMKYPFLGKVNPVYNREDIREIAIEGYKVIYRITPKSVLILVIYKNVDLDEADIGADNDRE